MFPVLSGRSGAKPVAWRGFTVIELLMVVAIIGILAALLYPLVGRAQQNARKAKTRVQFSQWATAIEGFRREYGFYPPFNSEGNPAALSGNRIDTDADTQIFVQTLSGRTLTGAAIVDGNPGYEAGNTKKIGFYTFGEGDLTKGAETLLQDGFGNTEIVVLLDTNYDGFVVVGSHTDYTTDHSTAPTVNGLQITFNAPVRAGVIFYSAGAANSEADIVKSWE